MTKVTIPNKRALTQRMVDGLKPTDREYWLMDTRVLGLGVRCRLNAAPRYGLRWTGDRGQSKKLMLWPTASVPLDDVRKIATRKLGEIASGRDPADERRKERHKTSIVELAEELIDAMRLAKRADTYVRDCEQQARDYVLPAIGTMAVFEVTSTDVDRLLGKVGKDKGALHNRVRAFVIRLMNYAVRHGFRADNPAMGSAKLAEAPRERLITDEELLAIEKALHANPGQTSDAIRMLMLTGARPKEVRSAKWEDLNLEAGVWTKPAMTVKQKRVHKVPLHPEAVRLLERIKNQAVNGDPYVFPSDGATGHLLVIKRGFAKVMKAANLDANTRPYDLRKAFATRLMSSGADLRTVMSLTGHSQPGVLLRHYAQADESQQRKALEEAFKKGK